MQLVMRSECDFFLWLDILHEKLRLLLIRWSCALETIILKRALAVHDLNIVFQNCVQHEGLVIDVVLLEKNTNYMFRHLETIFLMRNSLLAMSEESTSKYSNNFSKRWILSAYTYSLIIRFKFKLTYWIDVKCSFLKYWNQLNFS